LYSQESHSVYTTTNVARITKSLYRLQYSLVYVVWSWVS